MNDNTDFISAKQAAQIAGVHIATVYRWCESGQLKNTNIDGLAILIKRSDLMAYLESRTMQKKSLGQDDQ